MSDILETMHEYAKFAETKSEREAFEAVIDEITTLRARLAPVDDEALTDMAVIAIHKEAEKGPVFGGNLIPAAISAIRPHIEAAERERCAKKIEPTGPRPCDCDSCSCGNIGDAQTVAAWDEATANAAAIRSGK